MGKKKPAPLAFSFGDPEPVLSGAVYEYLGVWLLNNGRYYATPVPWSGLARLLRANAYHGPILEFKTNMAMRGFRASAALTRRDMHAVATDYMVFANAYLLLSRNWLGEVARMRHLPAINMRRMNEPDRYGLLLPSGAIQSMLLNEDATLFRRRYYKNGAHVGYIFYSSSAQLEQAQQDAIKNAIQNARGVGNFRNMFLHIPNGREKDVQIVPVGTPLENKGYRFSTTR